MSPPSLDKSNPNNPNNSNNPYTAPGADLNESFQQDGRRFVPEGISVGSEQAMIWYSRGLELFKAEPGIWIANSLISFVLFMILVWVPILGFIANNILIPVLIGGFMLGCAAQVRHQPLVLGQMFDGFKTHFGPLAMIGILYFAGFFVIGIIIAILCAVVIGGAGMGAMMGAMMGKGVAGGILAGGIGVGILLAILVGTALSIPLFMAIWFAPCLVVLHDMTPAEAMKASFSGCLKNMLPFLVYGILYIVFAFIATIPFLLGWLVFGPVLIASIYFSYEDIYLSN